MGKKIKISYFENVKDTIPKTIDLHSWLDDTINPPKKLKKQVTKYRNLLSRNLKQQIPCVTISASFKKYRNLDHIKSKTNLICLDIDPAENPIADMSKIKYLFSQHPSTLYCGYSVSNSGVYAIIRVSEKKPLIKYFKHFKRVLDSVGVKIDESCKDYTRLRFFSVDKEAYYNKKARVFEIPKKKKKLKYKSTGTASKSDEDKVEAIVALIESNAIDITTTYDDWYKVGGALYNAFGEKGREYFHRVSKYNHGYSFKECEKKYNNCRNIKSLRINTFFHIADSHGIRY